MDVYKPAYWKTDDSEILESLDHAKILAAAIGFGAATHTENNDDGTFTHTWMPALEDKVLESEIIDPFFKF